jgi:LEA14-like dessication related protein
MSIKKGPYAPLLAFLLPLFVCVSCSRYIPPTLQGFEKVRILGLGKEGRIQFDLIVHNPNRVGCRLRKAAGEAWLNGTSLGPFEISGPVEIPPKSDFRIPVLLRPKVKNLFNSALALIGTGDGPELRVEGQAWLAKGMLRFKYPIRYRERVRILQ